MSDALLEARGIKTYYGHIQALKDITIKAKRGELVCIIGTNGAGKSTFLKTIIGLVKPVSGQVIYDQKDITLLPTHKIVRRGVSLVLEGRQLFAPLSVRDNLLLGSYNLSPQKRKKSLNESLDEIYRLFSILRKRSDQKAGTLSGGEQQMVAIGRALMSSPCLLLLDEPSLGLAPLVVRKIFSSLCELNKRGLSIVLVEQNANSALRISHYGYVLDTGRITAEGSGRELLSNEDVKSAYLGKKK